MSKKVQDAKAHAHHMEHTLNQMHRQWNPLGEYLVNHPDRRRDENEVGEDLTYFALRLLKERDAYVHCEKEIVLNGDKHHHYGDAIFHNVKIPITWKLRWALITGTVMHSNGAIYTERPVNVVFSKLTLIVDSVFDRFKRKKTRGMTSGPLPSNMKYEYQKLVGNKVIGLAIRLEPGEEAKDAAPQIKEEDYDKWTGDIKTASRDLVKDSPEANEFVEVQITHPNGSTQEMSFEDAKTFIVRA